MVLLENIAVPNPTDNDLSCLVRQKNIGFLSRNSTKSVTLPLLSCPSGKGGQLLFFADSGRHGPNECLRLSQIVDGNDQHGASVASQLHVISPTRNVGSLCFSRMLDCSPHNHTLSRTDGHEEGSDDDQQDSESGDDGLSDFDFTPKIMTPFLIFVFGLL